MPICIVDCLYAQQCYQHTPQYSLAPGEVHLGCLRGDECYATQRRWISAASGARKSIGI